MKKLMIVDDSMLIRKKIAREFDPMVFKLVGAASNGNEAVEMFHKFRPEVVTMDITMPEFDGIQCIEALVEIDPDVNILVVSALKDLDTGMEAIEKGAQGFINKPFTQQKLIDALEELTAEDDDD